MTLDGMSILRTPYPFSHTDGEFATMSLCLLAELVKDESASDLLRPRPLSKVHYMLLSKFCTNGCCSGSFYFSADLRRYDQSLKGLYCDEFPRPISNQAAIFINNTRRTKFRDQVPLTMYYKPVISL